MILVCFWESNILRFVIDNVFLNIYLFDIMFCLALLPDKFIFNNDELKNQERMGRIIHFKDRLYLLKVIYICNV